jgi:hypothetical protein
LTIEPTVVIAAFGGLITALSAVARIVYTDLRKDRDLWRKLALDLMAVNHKAVDVAAKTLDA